MPQMILLLDEIEDKIVRKHSYLWKKSKAETIKKIIRDFKEDDSLNEVNGDVNKTTEQILPGT